MHFGTLEPKALWRSALAASAFGIICLAVTAPLVAQKAAQPTWVFETFAARKQPASGPVFGGIGITNYRRLLGLRLGGAAHFQGGNSERVCDALGCQEPLNVSVTAWTADADLLIEPLRPHPLLRKLLLGFSPYAFVGIGGYGVRRDAAPDSNIATWSYGAGVHHDLVGPLGIQAEARYRRPLEGDTGVTHILRENLEYRIGFRVSFGGRSQTKSKPIPQAPPRSEPSTARFESTVLDVAETYLNTPYWYGGASPYGGFDAGGFVQYVFARAGVRLPRKAIEIAEMGEDVSLRIGSLRPGDLVFFASDGRTIDHVAIYAGHERIIHATASGGGVRYDALGEGDRGRWFADHLVSARRVAGGDGTRPPIEAQPDKSLDPPDAAPPSTRAPR